MILITNTNDSEMSTKDCKKLKAIGNKFCRKLPVTKLLIHFSARVISKDNHNNIMLTTLQEGPKKCLVFPTLSV